MPSHCLPNHLYSASLIGRNALHAMMAGSPLTEAGDHRSKFIVDMIESAATLPHSTYCAERITTLSARRRYQYIRHLAIVPGFCYVRLFRPEWVVPAICALGPYPFSIDVASLQYYFRAEGKAVFQSGIRQGCRVLHIVGNNRFINEDKAKKLLSFGVSRVGSQRDRYYVDSGPPRMPPPNTRPRSRPPPVSRAPPMPPRGVPPPRPRQRDRSSPAPFTTYSRNPNQ